jgi:hypothetical protein
MYVEAGPFELPATGIAFSAPVVCHSFRVKPKALVGPGLSRLARSIQLRWRSVLTPDHPRRLPRFYQLVSKAKRAVPTDRLSVSNMMKAPGLRYRGFIRETM